ncbi:hypothetical protein X943_001383 [Babesia divergens]|uniref:Uncharacterized protein n=1 Tax=Babesia divergens TaxID=32595 RepID=A0AAD9GGD7_BABDI|nr:hypothetical protein X943_001383 [Babesia divergens]
MINIIILTACLPKTFAALFFLFFNVSNDCNQIGGGTWNSLPVNDSGQNLYNWLIGGSDDDDFIARGFLQGELHKSNNGQNVAQELKKAVSLKPSKTEGSLQNVLCGFMFVCKWNDALLGHALCFLSMFCVTVQSPQKNFEGYSEELKDVCRELSGSLTSFVQGSSQSHILAVSQSTNVYTGVFKDDSLDAYCDWLRDNLKNIIKSLQSMSSESTTWDSDKLQGANTAGPFLYGFVPKDNKWQDYMTRGNLQGPISKLTASLRQLKEYIDTASSGSSSSAGATAGGVFTGLFGLGGAGAGAAYATNAFGFQNFITGLISGFLK